MEMRFLAVILFLHLTVITKGYQQQGTTKFPEDGLHVHGHLSPFRQKRAARSSGTKVIRIGSRNSGGTGGCCPMAATSPCAAAMYGVAPPPTMPTVMPERSEAMQPTIIMMPPPPPPPPIPMVMTSPQVPYVIPMPAPSAYPYPIMMPSSAAAPAPPSIPNLPGLSLPGLSGDLPSGSLPSGDLSGSLPNLSGDLPNIGGDLLGALGGRSLPPRLGSVKYVQPNKIFYWAPAAKPGTVIVPVLARPPA